MPSALKDFKVLAQLGKGSYGSVMKVERITDGNIYAMKEVNIRRLSPREREDAVNEIRILASIKSKNIVRYCDAFVEKDNLYIIMEFAEGGDIGRQIEKFKKANKYIKEDTIWSYVIQICRGLNEMHGRSILHRDIKPKNIFLTGKNHVRLGDLGCAKLMKTGLARTQIGTPYYMSPEIWLNKPYDSKSDMWALGCLLYELAMLVPPFLANDMNGLAVKVKTTPATRISKHYSDDLAGLVAAMLNKDARLRPDVRQVLTHPAVTARLHTVPEGDDTPWAGDDLRSAMLSTIRVPVGFGYGGGKPAGLVLPAPSYPALRRADSAPSGLSAEEEGTPSSYGGGAAGGFAAGAYDAAPASAAGGAGAPAPVAAPRAVSFARPAAPQPTSFAAATSPPQLGRYLKRMDSASDAVGLGVVEKENAYAAQLRAAAAGAPPMARVPSAGALLAVPSTNAAGGGVRQLVSVPSSRAMLGAGAAAAAPLSSAAAGGYGLGAGRALAPLSAVPSSRPSLIPTAGGAAAGAGGYGMGVPSSAVAAKLAALPPSSGAAAGAPIRKYVAAHQLPPSSAAGGAGIYSRPAAMAAPSAAYGAAGVAAPRYSAYGALPSAGGLGAAAAAPAAGRYLMRHL